MKKLNKAIQVAAGISALVFVLYAIACASSGKDPYGYICAALWAFMFVAFKGGGE